MAVERGQDPGDPELVAVDRGVSAGGQIAVTAELGQEAPLGVERAAALGVLQRRPERHGWPRRRTDTRSASAPWATWGTMTAGSSGSATSPSRPRRSRPAMASTIASNRWAAARRVSMLPRSSAKVRSGRRYASWARRRTEPVATVPPVGISSKRAPTRASRGSARSGTAAMTRPSGVPARQVLARVHRHVGPPVEHRGLHLLDEDALAPDLPERSVAVTVAFGGDDDQLDRRRRTGVPQSRWPRSRPASGPGRCPGSRCGRRDGGGALRGRTGRAASRPAARPGASRPPP